MKIVDAHHHLWIPEQPDAAMGYRWLKDIGAMKPFGDPTPIQRDYEWQEFADESENHELAGSVYVQVDGAIGDPIAETAWVQSIFDKTDLPHAIVGLLDLSADNAEAMLEPQTRYTCFRGVRQILSRLDDNPALCFAASHYLRNPVWRDNFRLLGQHQLSFDLQLYPEQMSDAAEFFSQHSNTPVIIDHAGSPYDQSAAGINNWQQGLTQLASLEHVAIKLSGFGMFDRQRSAESLRPMIEFILMTFGADRVMFGSNFPVDKLMGSYDSIVDILCDTCAQLTEAERQSVFHDTSINWYKPE